MHKNYCEEVTLSILAEQVGYSDAYYFSRVKKNRFCPPA
ncbi:AraC family transcriptional regulator [Mediterraneibacter massiliensis]